MTPPIDSSVLPTPDEVWRLVVDRLRSDPNSASFNCFDEVCGRWNSAPARLALTICHPDGTDERWTYRELDEQSAAAAKMLRDLGVRRGDRVASLLSRQAEAWILALGAWRCGIVLVPIFVGFGADAIRDRLVASKASAVVADHRQLDGAIAALAGLDSELPLIVVGPTRSGSQQRAALDFWAELQRPRVGLGDVAVAGADAATLMFTSGTTSQPKACVIPHNGYLSLVPFVEHALALDQTDLLFATSDPGWSYGLYTCGAAPMSLGIPRVLYSGDFEPEAWLQLMADRRVTYAAGAPTAVRRLLAAAQATGITPSLRGMATGGEPMDEETVVSWHAATGTQLRDGYGLTEVGMVLSNLGRPELDVRPGWLAAPVPGFAVQLVDESGAAVAAGEPGILRIERPRFQLTSRYENAPDAWQQRWVDGYFVTDDLFVTDDAGRYRFVGRRDDIIVTSGYNVGPAEVEAVLLRRPDVLEAAVVAHPDPARGSIVRAVVVAAPGSDLERLSDEIRSDVRRAIGRHAYPRVIDFVDELPRTSTGKVLRTELRRPTGAR